MLPQDNSANLLRNRKDKDLGSQRSNKSIQTVLVTKPHDVGEDEVEDDFDNRATTYSEEVRKTTFWQEVVWFVFVVLVSNLAKASQRVWA